MPTHYETLGVKASASAAEIRKAYLRRARALHPDRQLDRPAAEAAAAEQAMRQVNEAWNVLSDPTKKSEYDKRASPRRQPQPAPRAAAAPQRPAPPKRTAASANGSQGRQTDQHARNAEDREADGSVSIWASIPVLIVIGLALGIFIITAFVDRDRPDIREPAPSTTNFLTAGDCFYLAGEVPRQTGCMTGTADGLVLEVVPERGNCPAGALSVTDPDSSFVLCYERRIQGSVNPVDG